jgi:hypothetical protein
MKWQRGENALERRRVPFQKFLEKKKGNNNNNI